METRAQEKSMADCLGDTFLSGETPQVSVVLPFYNQAGRISDVLAHLVDSMELRYELILIDDASPDSGWKSASHFLRYRRPDNLVRYRIFRMKRSRFETGSDAFGFDVATADFFLELQADMLVSDFGFDRRLIEVFEAFPDIIALSGRGAEPILPVAEQYRMGLGSVVAPGGSLLVYSARRVMRYIVDQLARLGNRKLTAPIEHFSQGNINLRQVTPEASDFVLTGRAGRLGRDISMQLGPDFPTNRVWLSQTVMRGPLAIDARKYRAVGGFDTGSFFLGFDDHEFALRSFLKFGYRTGFVPVNFDSPLEHGSTRKARSLGEELSIIAQLFKVRRKRRKTLLADQASLDMLASLVPEIREIPG